MRIILWATTFQADILALAAHLDGRADCELMVVAQKLENWCTEPVARHLDWSSPMLARETAGTERAARDFGADVVVFDNHFPPQGLAPQVCAMWHGLGWKARPARNVRSFHKKIEDLTGQSPDQPISGFFAQCYHERDQNWRINDWGLAAENCRVIGMAFSDLLLNPPYDRKDVAGLYDIDVVGKKTLLVSITWHYGRIFQQNWKKAGLLRKGTPVEDDLQFLEMLVDRVMAEGANILLCLHDKHRYESHYLDALWSISRDSGAMFVKHKDENPDNLADLLVADAMVTNLSSFITYFYHLGRPTVHICPPEEQREQVTMATMKGGKLREQKEEARYMNRPEDNGGLTAYTARETLSAVVHALRNPDCCKASAKRWVAEHIHQPDGHTAKRFADALMDLVH